MPTEAPGNGTQTTDPTVAAPNGSAAPQTPQAYQDALNAALDEVDRLQGKRDDAAAALQSIPDDSAHSAERNRAMVSLQQFENQLSIAQRKVNEILRLQGQVAARPPTGQGSGSATKTVPQQKINGVLYTKDDVQHPAPDGSPGWRQATDASGNPLGGGTQVGPASPSTTPPTDPSKWVSIKDPDGRVLAVQDPVRGTTVAVPQGPARKSGTEDSVQGGTIYHWQYDDQGNPHLVGSDPAPDPSRIPDGTKTVIPSAGGWGIPATYKNGQAIPTGEAAIALTPQAQRPPQEGDTRPNVSGGYKVQEVYRGGQWVVDTSVPPTSFVPQPPEVVNPGTGPNIVMRNPQTGELTTTPNPNTTDIASRVTQLQTAASKQRDALNAQVLNGTLTKEQAAQQFDQWWAVNIAPQEQQLQQQQATQVQDAQLKASADQRAQAAEDRANLTTAQTAGQNAAQRAEAMLPYMVGPGFGDALNNIQKAYATGKAPGNIDLGSAVTFQMPDLNSIAETATAQALAHLSPTAASKVGAPMPSIPQGIDIAGALNKSNYAPTTTIAPDGTVTIQHAPVSQPATIPNVNGGLAPGISNLPPSMAGVLSTPVDPTEFIGNYVPALAGGGPTVPGQPYVVGEQGPELFVPDTAGTVLPTPNAPVPMRFYHGTAADFGAVSKAKLGASSNLFGPGLYLTDNPTVASSYAITRQGPLGGGPMNYYEQQGANVRPYDVPANMQLLDADSPLRALGIDQDGTVADAFRTFSPGSQNEFVNYLASQGYDGITYGGGRIMPIQNAAGEDVLHTALSVFPNSVGKLKQALTGMSQEANVVTGLGDIVGTALGRAYAQQGDPNDPLVGFMRYLYGYDKAPPTGNVVG